MLSAGEAPEVILANIKKHVRAWDQGVQTLNDIKISRLNGLSNACYRVELQDWVSLSDTAEKRVFLYRKFECTVNNKEIEAIIFQNMSEKNLGPKLVFACDEYRIEEFFDGRPMTIWEMSDPVIMKIMARKIFEHHYKSGNGEKLQLI